jgi:hypothetical protein
MNKLIRFAFISLIMLGLPAQALAQESWTPEQQELIEAIEKLSAATAPSGAGADAYGANLSEEFNRWTIGSAVFNDKNTWVEGVREWFDDGWRVSDRNTRDQQILVRDDYAFIRRIVEETYLGPDNESSVSTAALAEVWVRSDHGWLLLYVNVHPM